ncbi:cytochrome p450 monooxygenase [Colletotrichum truncatum]|uniref:Cytochrome p450 monooxygenase n=1 Tax=Colletotrichum truncatum TaxID=5467 RepID=A0ACC3YR17_COLTU|nr:cytochrome p450 monooxygenase [Colletotrichum truncatum]KAF6799097.1 cytochrome p450 monooxygenase [Colletotrichum truncatum]
MEGPNSTSFADATVNGFSATSSPWYLAASCTLLLVLSLASTRNRGTKLPYLNPKKRFEWSSARAVGHFIANARKMLYDTANSLSGKPFRVLNDIGDVIVLPPDFGQEIRNDKRFSFTQGLYEDFQGKYAGFEPYKESCHPSGRLQNVVRLRLTKTLGKITAILSKEADLVIQETLSDSKEPHDVVLKKAVLEVISRLSGRIFVGERLGRNKEWLHTVISYVELSIFAMQSMRMWPEFVRPLAAWFLPGPRKLRAYIKDAEKFVFDELKRRRDESPSVEYNDAIEWFDEMAKGQRYNPAVAQLILASVAVHTTADLVTQTMYDILQNPDLIQPLREEAIRVIGEEGWKKTSLHNLKLMDSVLKESQRLKPVQIVGMNRRVMENVQLSDGTKITRGSATVVSAERMWDPEIYKKPLEFDGYRFYRQRGGPNDAVSQLVSTSVDHMGFRHGMHSCPGRFFAGNEAKVVLVHLLLKYDFEFAEGQKPKFMEFGFSCESDSSVKVSVRRRQEEIDLSVQDSQE